MSCRNALILLACLVLAAAETRADPGAPGACRDAAGQQIAEVDCSEYLVRLDFESRRLEAQAKVEEAQARIRKAKQAAEPSGPDNPRPLPGGSLPMPSSGPGLAAFSGLPDRTLEVIGGQRARIRYRGQEMEVRAGDRLPAGGQVVQVSLAGVVLMNEDGGRHDLPFAVGGR